MILINFDHRVIRARLRRNYRNGNPFKHMNHDCACLTGGDVSKLCSPPPHFLFPSQRAATQAGNDLSQKTSCNIEILRFLYLVS